MLPIQSQLRIQAHCGCVESWLQLCLMKVNLEPVSGVEFGKLHYLHILEYLSFEASGNLSGSLKFFISVS